MVKGRIDHLAVDVGRRRLFVAELGAGAMTVVDFDQGRVTQTIGDLREPQGIGYAPAPTF